MERKTFAIRNKEVKIPLLQGGMGVGISLGGLAGAVAKEGAVGVISAAQPGYREPDFLSESCGSQQKSHALRIKEGPGDCAGRYHRF